MSQTSTEATNPRANLEERTRGKILEKKLTRQLKNACMTFGLLAEGDKVMVALSGGKDSYTMLDLMSKLVKRLPFSVELVAVHLDQKQPGYDGTPLRGWLEESGHAFEILSEDTYSVVTDHIAEGNTYCSLCSRLRRGILYSTAERLGCNKIALGHHRDDSLETLLMNLFFSGKMQAMPAKYKTDDEGFEVIRPLMFAAEEDIAAFAAYRAYPILPCKLCGSQSGLQRQEMKALLSQLEAQNPNVKSVMLRALSNVRPTHLLDAEVLEAWQERPAHIPDKSNASKNLTQEPTSSSKGLPLI